MSLITVMTHVSTSPERCFDLARDIDLHQKSLQHTSEQAIAGRTAGLIEYGESVTWRGKHLGFYHTHTAKITQYDRPSHFRDEMTKGRFKSFIHDHYFEPAIAPHTGTRMTDVLVFHSPFGLMGTLVDTLILKRYMRKVLEVRASHIAQAATLLGSDWKNPSPLV